MNKNPPENKSSGPESLTGEYYQTFNEYQIEEGRTFPSSFYKASIALILPNKDTIRKLQISILVSADVKILNKFLVNWIQQHIKMIKWLKLSGIYLWDARMIQHIQSVNVIDHWIKYIIE